jgi:5-methylcytosine-specific restriction protein B
LVQFHHSYQYEDFVEGFVPQEGGGFQLKPKHLLEMCEIARDARPNLCVLVVDELSRSDPGRVFGEALTYIEMNRRERKFRLASGREVSIPRNLVILATMNPMDPGADQVDAAFERRFAKIAMEPNVQDLQDILADNGMDENLQQLVIEFFHFLENHPNQHARVGHAYFIHARDVESLKRLWHHQLKFHLQRAFQLSPEGYERAEAMWKKVLSWGDSGDADQAVSTEPQAREGEEEAE